MLHIEHIDGLRMGIIFDILTDHGKSTNVRSTPSTREELMAAGLSEDNVGDYFDLINRLYGNSFIVQNEPDQGYTSYGDMYWAELCDFAFDNKLILPLPEYMHPSIYLINSYMYSMPLRVRCFDECAFASFVPSVAEYRLELEKCLAGIGKYWELAARYGVYVKYDNPEQAHLEVWDEERDMLVRFDRSQHEYLFRKALIDLRDIWSATTVHKYNAPTYNVTTVFDVDETIENGRTWLTKRRQLESENRIILECYDVLRSQFSDSRIPEMILCR